MIALAACSGRAPNAPSIVSPVEGSEVEVGSLFQLPARISLDVLVPTDGDIPAALARARDDVRQQRLRLVDSLPTATSNVLATVQLVSVDDENWDHRLPGYVESTIDRSLFPRVDSSVAVVRIEARAPAAMAWDMLRAVAATARDVAASQNGWIYDSYRAELFDADTFSTSIPDAQLHDVRAITRIMGVYSTKGGLDHVRSIGLWRLGLPELYLPDVPNPELDDAVDLVRATAQTLIQSGGVTRAGVIEVDLTKLPPDWPRPASGTRRFAWHARWMRGPIHHNAMVIALAPKDVSSNDPIAFAAALKAYAGTR